MKQASKLFIASLLTIMIVIPLVTAITLQKTVVTVTGVDFAQSIEDIIVRAAVFLILLFAFSDIIWGFGPFSQLTSWMIGLGLAMISAAVGWVANIASGMFIFTAIFGTLSVTAAIIMAFLTFLAVLFGFGAFGQWLKNRQAAMMRDSSIKTMKGGMKILKEIGKEGAK